MRSVRFTMLLTVWLCLCMAISAQNKVPSIDAALARWFAAYSPSNYRPANPMLLDSYIVNDSSRTIEVYGNESFSSQAFTPTIFAGIYKSMQTALPQPYNAYRLTIYGKNNRRIDDLIPSYLLDEADKTRVWGNVGYKGEPWVQNISRPFVPEKGLGGRHLSVWASHGRYYSNDRGRWQWQRPNLYATNEDLFTQSIVVPFLMPMLENAGAIVYTPRERDKQTHEVIVDNDNPQQSGIYEEKTKANPEDEILTADSGYSAPTGYTVEGENPFRTGTYRYINTTSRASRAVSFQWTPDIPESGHYATYVSYASTLASVSDAVYSVYHAGVRTDFKVNQQMGGGTWLYLGTFYYEKGKPRENRIVLTNKSNYRGVITADAVRLGGGMGSVARGASDEALATSGYPRFAEGARYSGQMAGLPYEVYSSRAGTNDYADDINVRSYATNYLGGGSSFIPGIEGGKVPFELALAVHSDAGINRSGIYGSLSISTTSGNNGVQNFLSGISRGASADFASQLLQTITEELTEACGTTWTRRETWDRNYSETRNPEVPSSIIETLSHQNFTDMMYGHDPNFKFALARAIYKSVLHFSNYQHGITNYKVQPLPITHFAITFADADHIKLQWQPAKDKLSASADPTSYIIYERVGDGDFDNGTLVEKGTSITLPIEQGVVKSYRVAAVNEGGESMPSEILSAYRSVAEVSKVLIVNGFTRLSGPAVVDNADSLGFDLDKDIGVAYGYTTEFCGRQKVFNRFTSATEGADALGYSGEELGGKEIAGNTFDFVYTHGRAIAASQRYSFVSASSDAVADGKVSLDEYPAIDLLMGLQKFTPYTLKYYKTFTPQLQLAIRKYTAGGGRILASGSYIASDMNLPEEQDFTGSVLKFVSGGTSRNGSAVSGLNSSFQYVNEPNARHYAAQSVDILTPTGGAFTSFAYPGIGSAGIAYRGTDYRVMAMGFPLECITGEAERALIMGSSLHFLLDK